MSTKEAVVIMRSRKPRSGGYAVTAIRDGAVAGRGASDVSSDMAYRRAACVALGVDLQLAEAVTVEHIKGMTYRISCAVDNQPEEP